MASCRIKVLPSHHFSPLQNQDLIDPKNNGLMEMILLHNQEPEFYMWLISTKSRTHACWGNWCFRGTILYRIKVIPSHHLSPLQNQNLMDPKKNGLMEMILLQNQEPEFYNILHLISLYKIKDPYMLGKKGFRETIFYRIKFIPSYYLKTTTKSRSEDLTLRGMLY